MYRRLTELHVEGLQVHCSQTKVLSSHCNWTSGVDDRIAKHAPQKPSQWLCPLTPIPPGTIKRAPGTHVISAMTPDVPHETQQIEVPAR